MERRSFMQSSAAAVCAVAAGSTSAADPSGKGVEFYELRAYQVKEGKQAMMDAYLSKAFIPAAKRLGSGPIGVFTETVEKGLPRTFVLIVQPSAEHFGKLATQLARDEEYDKAAADYLAVKPADAIYSRIESSLLAAIEGLPKIEKTDPSKARLFNLRIYESHNERAGKKKIEMFNKGEIAIFKRVGLTPVLFGEAIAGPLMPNLTYLLVFPDDDGRKAAWDKFRVDPEWLKLRAIPEYADKEIVSRITNILMSPTGYSEI
jgi:NIPSNAP